MDPILQLLSPEQAAPLLDCTPATVEDRLRDGTLPGVKFGRAWKIPLTALAQSLHDQALAEAAQRRESAEARPQLVNPAATLGAFAPLLGRRAPPPDLAA